MALSAPSSPRLGGRVGSPSVYRSFRGGGKEIGDITTRVQGLDVGRRTHRRDDGDSDEDGCCSGGGCSAAAIRQTVNSLRIPSQPRDRSKSPGLGRVPTNQRGLSPGNPRGLSPANPRGLSPANPRGLSPANPRGISPANARGISPAGQRAPQKSAVPSKRPNNLRVPASPSCRPSPCATPSPRASPSPRSSPSRHLGGDTRRHHSPAVSLRSPLIGPSGEVDLNDPEVLAKIGNRATKSVNKPTRNCDSCLRPLTEDGCTAFGKVYHKECFRCKECRVKLEGKFFTKGDHPYCSKCFKTSSEQCCVCQLKIAGDCVVNNENYYHPDCMKCHVCEIKLRGSYHFFQNKPICEKDFQETQQSCSTCGEVIEGTYYTLNDQVYCEKDYKDYLECCGLCGETISGKVIKITGAFFHPDCFKCQVCSMNLVGVHFSTDEKNQVYCSQDFTRKFAAFCTVCKNPIVPKEGQTTAPRIRAMDKDFHPTCFKCEDCGLVLDSRVKGKECWPIRSHVLCYQCYRRRQSESEEESE